MEGTPRSRGASEHPNSPAQTPPESRVREVATFRGASGVVGPMLPGASFSPTRCRFEPQTLPPTLREPACGVGGPGGAAGPRAAPGKSELRSRPRDPCRPPPPGLLAAPTCPAPRRWPSARPQAGPGAEDRHASPLPPFQTSRLTAEPPASRSARGWRAPTAQVAGLLPVPRVPGAAPRGAALASEGRRCAGRVLGGGTRAGHPAAGARDRVTPVPTSHEQLCVQMRARPSRASGVQEESPRHGAAGGQEGCPVHSAQ